MCVDCFEGVPLERPAPQWERIGDPFRASYNGLCHACTRFLSQGDLVQRWDKSSAAFPDRTVYTHVRCRP